MASRWPGGVQVFPQAEVAALRDVDLSLPAGSSVALVGENGAGKTTLVKLLVRFYEPTTRPILVDGIDLPRDAVAGGGPYRGRLPGLLPLRVPRRQTVGVGDRPRMTTEPAVSGAATRVVPTDVVDRPAGRARHPAGH